jgi:hypothetical protein
MSIALQSASDDPLVPESPVIPLSREAKALKKKGRVIHKIKDVSTWSGSFDWLLTNHSLM